MNNREDTTSITIWFLRGIGYFLITMGIVLFALYIVGSDGMRNAKDLRQLTTSDIRTGLFVKGEIVESGGIYSSKEYVLNGIPTEIWNYYVISFGEAYNNYMGFFTMLAQEDMNRMTEETSAYYNGKSDSIATTIEVTGLVLPIVGQCHEYYHTFMEPIPQDMYVDYYIVHIDSAMIGRFLSIGCVVVLIGMIIAVVAFLREKRHLGDEYKVQNKKRWIFKTLLFWGGMAVTLATVMIVFF